MKAKQPRRIRRRARTCGEGYLAIEAARWAARVIAVDRSEVVLQRARDLARRRRVANVVWKKGELEKLIKKHPKVYVEQRGTGFLQGLRCEVPAGDMVNKLQSLGMLVPPAGENVIRIFPALIADKAALDEGIAILEKAAVEFESAQSGTKAAE